jgi:hypothetical protein
VASRAAAPADFRRPVAGESGEPGRRACRGVRASILGVGVVGWRGRAGERLEKRWRLEPKKSQRSSGTR